MRDDFTAATRTKLALQAGYRCSYCDVVTSGPSDESPTAVVKTGMAAHIHAASPGGPRFLDTMTPAERKDIRNGIWMCRNHGTLVDEDHYAYTAESLRDMKRLHLVRIAKEQAGRNANAATKQELIALGPNLIMLGELVGITSTTWSFKIEHYIVGSFYSLIRFCEPFSVPDVCQHYLLMNEVGDGRQLAAAPSIERSDGGFVVHCPVANAAVRVDAHKLPIDIALNDAHDIFAQDGHLAKVSGLNALPQKIKNLLSLQYGESPFYPSAGSRLTEYFQLFRDSAWFADMLKLEVIRQASIPFVDPITDHSHTPLMSVRGVDRVTIVRPDARKNWTVLNFELDVEGVGAWEKEIAIYISESPEPDMEY